MNDAPEAALVSGVSGVVGMPLTRRLRELGHKVYEVSRDTGDQGKKWEIVWDLESDMSPVLPALTYYLHCAPIWVLPDNIVPLVSAGVKRVIAFSSSSVISKAKSADAGERALASLLRDGENRAIEACERHGVSLTLFRPTMIYGFGRDQNISRIAGIIQRYRVGVVAGGGRGLRQPVHVLDLVDAVEKVLDNPQTYSKTYILNGGETFTYREMMRRVFVGMGRKPRIVSVPVRVFRLLMKAAAMTGKFRYTAEMADRMNVDLSFNDEAAARDFGYAPAEFLENPERDLPGARHAHPGS